MFAKIHAVIEFIAKMKRQFIHDSNACFFQTWNFLVTPAGNALTSLTCAQYIMVPFFDDGCDMPPKILINLTAVAINSK